MSHPLVAQLNAELHDQPANPLRPHQIREYTAEKERVEEQLGSPLTASVGRGQATLRLRQLRQALQDAPRPIEEPLRKDRVAKLARQVRDEVIRPAMLPQEVMRRNPAGAVDRFLAQENRKDVKAAETAWRRALRALEPDNDQREYTSKETFRPTLGVDAVASFMAEAQIPGNFAMSPQAKANWPLGEPTVSTPYGQAVAREQQSYPLPDGSMTVRTKPGRRRGSTMTAEQRRAFGEKMKAARQARMAAATGEVPVGAA